MEGGLEEADFDVDFNMQLHWRGWRNCGSIISLAIPGSPVTVLRDIGIKKIEGDFLSLRELSTPAGSTWSTHINNDALTSLNSTEEAEYQKYPVPDVVQFVNPENGLKWLFYMLVGEGSMFFVELDKDISEVVLTSLCYDLQITFDSYTLSSESCYLEYEEYPPPADNP